MKLSFTEIKTRLQNYFHNNPKRITLAWIGMHIFFLFFGFVGLAVNKFTFFSIHDVLGLSGIMVFAFPNTFISYIISFFSKFFNLFPLSSFTLFVSPIAYYLLFVTVIVAAKDTMSKKFKILHRIFAFWFIADMFTSLYMVFFTIQ
jgi:hypothetical protein